MLVPPPPFLGPLEVFMASRRQRGQKMNLSDAHVADRYARLWKLEKQQLAQGYKSKQRFEPGSTTCKILQHPWIALGYFAPGF